MLATFFQGSQDLIPTETHAFVVRIWLESGLHRPDGRTLWRGRVQHAASGNYLVFEAMDDLVRFITSWMEIGDESPGPIKPTDP